MKSRHNDRFGIKYGAGFSRNNLYRFIAFYKSFPDIFHAVSANSQIIPSLTGQSEKVPSLTGLFESADFYAILQPIRPLRLSWTHYSIILQDVSLDARHWYEQEAAREMWGTRTILSVYLLLFCFSLYINTFCFCFQFSKMLSMLCFLPAIRPPSP